MLATRHFHFPFAAASAAVLVFLIVAPAHAGPDSGEGQKIFNRTCGTCHSAQPGQNRIGPSLAGVVGRKAGQVDGYDYSDANRQSGITWDPATLDTYLGNPRGLVPGTKMGFPGLKDPDQRANVIAFLETLK